MKHLILIFLLFYLASCVEGEQKVTISGQGEGATAPSPLTITQKTASGSPQSLEFLPPNLAFVQPNCINTFCPDDQYPFLQDTVATLQVEISNPSNLPFTLEWTLALNNGVPDVVEVFDNPTQSSFSLDMTNTALFSNTGFYTIKSILKDSTGKEISTNSWSIELVGANPTYENFSPSPAPTPYLGSPFSVSNNIPQTITAVISNPSSSNYINNWFLDGVLQSSSDQAGNAIVTFPFTPSAMAIGNHVVVAQLTGNPDTTIIYNTATWSFEVTELPQFSTFSNPQLPSPAPFPDVLFGVGNPDILLNPNPLYNPSNASFTVKWELDGAIDATATFNGGPGNDNPPPYIIDPDNATQFGVGRHSVVVLLYDTSATPTTLVDSASWNFEVVFPPPAYLTAVNPATSTQIFSVSTIPMDGTSPMGGFFVGPESPSSRGTPMVVALPNSSSNTFCINVSDGRGVGFGYAPTSAGVLVQYEYSDSTPINAFQLQFAQSASPTAVCLDGKGAINPADGVPNFSLNDTPTLNTFITAIVTDKLSLQEIGRVQWNITVTELNTQPDLLIAAPFSTTTVATVVQDATYTYSFTVADQDCSPSLSKLNCYSSIFSMVNPIYTASPGVALNGTNTYYGGTGVVTPDCERDYSYAGLDKFRCVIMVPSNNGIAPMPTTGTYQVTAQVNNLSIWDNGSPTYVGTPTNYFGPMVVSDLLTWNLTVIEVNTGGPVLLNQLASGSASPTVNSYMYVPANPLAVATTATEGDTIYFNLVVNDPQKDNYKIKFFHDTASASGTFTEYNATPTYTYSISDNPVNGSVPASMTIAPFSLPFGLVTGAPSATITFQVKLTDVPDSASPMSNTFNFSINVFNVNPPPEVVTSSEKPALAATGTVMQGFPYTMWADITDSSVGEGSEVEWQWMINQIAADCASKTAASWKSITGADEGGIPLLASPPLNASLTWSPPAIPATTTYCFRNCIGDDDFPGLNPATCTPAMAGPWVGPITGTIADIPDIASGSLNPDRGDTAVWADPVIDGDIYGLRVSGNKIFLFKYVYNLDTTVNQTNAVFTTRQGAPATTTLAEGAYDLSITGNNNFIFVSYVFNNPGILPPFVSVPTNMVLRISKFNFSSVDYFFNDRVPLGVGQVVANDSAFWVPYVNSSLGDTPFFFAGDGVGPATTTINGSFGVPDAVAEIQSREQNGDLFIALKLTDGSVDLYQYTLGAFSTPTFKASDPDIFSNFYVPFSDMSLAVGTATNPNVFVAGIDTSTKAIFYGIKPIANIFSNNLPFVVPDISSATAIYPVTFDPKGLNAVASTKPGEILLGFVNAAATTRAPFADLYILKSDGTNLKLSSRINRNRIDIPSPKKITSDDFALTNVNPKFQIGSAGAVATENQKDTIWFRYWDYSTDRMVIVNIENETFSNSTPTLGTEAWSDPWFKQ